MCRWAVAEGGLRSKSVPEIRAVRRLRARPMFLFAGSCRHAVGNDPNLRLSDIPTMRTTLRRRICCGRYCVNHIPIPRPPPGSTASHPSTDADAAHQFLKSRVDIYDISLPRRCIHGRLQSDKDVHNRIPAKGIGEEQHERLGSKRELDRIHAMQREFRTPLRSRRISLDVVFRDLVQLV